MTCVPNTQYPKSDRWMPLSVIGGGRSPVLQPANFTEVL